MKSVFLLVLLLKCCFLTCHEHQTISKKTWTCPFCGKVFDKPTAHKCVPSCIRFQEV